MDESELKAMIYDCIFNALEDYQGVLSEKLYDSDENTHCTISQAQKKLQCSKGHVHKLMREGNLSYAKSGRKTLIEKASIERYLNDNTPNGSV